MSSAVYETEVVEETSPSSFYKSPLPPNEETAQPTVEVSAHLPTIDPTKIPNPPTPTAVPTNVKTRIEDSNFFRVDSDYFEFNFAGSQLDPQIDYFALEEDDCYYLPENSLTNGIIEFEFNDEENTIIERPNNYGPLKCSIS